jgi:hypothetical protein
MHGHWPFLKKKPEPVADTSVIVERGSDSSSGTSDGKGINSTIVAQREIGGTGVVSM